MLAWHARLSSFPEQIGFCWLKGNRRQQCVEVGASRHELSFHSLHRWRDEEANHPDVLDADVHPPILGFTYRQVMRHNSGAERRCDHQLR